MRQDGGAEHPKSILMLVFVHGLSASSRWWRPVLRELRGRGVHLVDLPRIPGRSEQHLVDELEPRAPVTLVGHSLGGLVAARVAAARPDLVRALVLVSPAGAPGRPLHAYAAGLARTLAGAPPAVLAAVTRDALRTGPLGLAAGAVFALRAQPAATVDVPTLLVWGGRDALLPPELAATWQARLPHARLALIPDAGHAPMLETPSAFARLLAEFVDELGDDARV
jgi:pimeloyl-ACP methyl ester carboxylesterase